MTPGLVASLSLLESLGTLSQGLATNVDFALWGHSGNIWRHFQVLKLGKGLLLASRG